MSHALIPANRLLASMCVDLENDMYADPNGDNDWMPFEYGQVYATELETPACVRIDFDNYSCGFPPEHLLKVRRDTLPADMYTEFGEAEHNA